MIALIAGAVVVGLISIELFVYKMLKLKKNNHNNKAAVQ